MQGQITLIDVFCMLIDVLVCMPIHFWATPIYVFAIFLYILHFVHHSRGVTNTIVFVSYSYTSELPILITFLHLYPLLGI